MRFWETLAESGRRARASRLSPDHTVPGLGGERQAARSGFAGAARRERICTRRGIQLEWGGRNDSRVESNREL